MLLKNALVYAVVYDSRVPGAQVWQEVVDRPFALKHHRVGKCRKVSHFCHPGIPIPRVAQGVVHPQNNLATYTFYNLHVCASNHRSAWYKPYINRALPNISIGLHKLDITWQSLLEIANKRPPAPYRLISSVYYVILPRTPVVLTPFIVNIPTFLNW